MAEAGQSAEIQHEKRADGCDRCPENARRNRVADFRHGQVGMRQSFLVMHHGIVHRQAKQNGGEAHADDVDRPEDQAAQGKRAGQDQRQQSEQPQHGPPASMVEPEQHRDDQRRAADRGRDIAFHAAGDLGDEGRAPGVADGDAV